MNVSINIYAFVITLDNNFKYKNTKLLCLIPHFLFEIIYTHFLTKTDIINDKN